MDCERTMLLLDLLSNERAVTVTLDEITYEDPTTTNQAQLIFFWDFF